MGIVEKFIKEGQLTKEEYPELLRLYQDVDAVRLLREEAVRIQKKYFGNKIYTRGLIEFTNYCSQVPARSRKRKKAMHRTFSSGPAA